MNLYDTAGSTKTAMAVWKRLLVVGVQVYANYPSSSGPEALLTMHLVYDLHTKYQQDPDSRPNLGR